MLDQNQYSRILIQLGIAEALGVKPTFKVESEVGARIDFLENYLIESGMQGYVLGVSGGVDSTTAARMMAIACSNARLFGHACQSIAVRLPYGEQADEADASLAINFVQANVIETVNIKPAVDAAMAAMDLRGLSKERIDFIKGNVKARERMNAQYAIAAKYNSLVIGTDHASEAVMGFFTKHGDGAADVIPLSGATKAGVRAMAAFLGAPDNLVTKAPTADLEDLRPGLLDEVAYGVTYDDIEDFLMGNTVTDHVFNTIIKAYHQTAHKRALPVAPK